MGTQNGLQLLLRRHQRAPTQRASTHREPTHRERQNGLQRHGTTNPATIATTRKELSKEGALSRKRERKGRKRRGNRNLSNLTRDGKRRRRQLLLQSLLFPLLLPGGHLRRDM